MNGLQHIMVTGDYLRCNRSVHYKSLYLMKYKANEIHHIHAMINTKLNSLEISPSTELSIEIIRKA